MRSLAPHWSPRRRSRCGRGCRARGPERLDYSAAGSMPTAPGRAAGPRRSQERSERMCGIVGVVAHTPVNQLLYDGLLLLQHRGQDAAGIVTSEGAMFHMHKGTGLRARRVPHPEHARALGQRRHRPLPLPDRRVGGRRSSSRSRSTSTRRSASRSAHNGNLTNSEALKRELFQLDFRHVNTNSDSEVLLNVLALELERAAQHARLDADAIFNAVAGVHRRCRGAYAIVAMIAGYGLLAFRDPVRHPAADHRRQRGDGRHASTSSPASRSRSRRSASRCCATSRRARRSSSTSPGTFHARQCAANPSLQPLHLRVRLPGAARLGDRRHVGVRGAAADGRRARAQDRAACRRRRTSTS